MLRSEENHGKAEGSVASPAKGQRVRRLKTRAGRESGVTAEVAERKEETEGAAGRAWWQQGDFGV